MGMRRIRSLLTAFASALSIACFLTFSLAAVTGALAADTGTFESWPKKATEPGVEPPAAKAGAAAGAKTASGLSAGTWGWIAAGAAAVLAVTLIAAGGGGGTTSSPVCNQ